MDPYGIESKFPLPPCPDSVDASSGVGGELSTGKEQAQHSSILLIGVAALTLFFVPQLLQLFPALGGLQIAKLTALLVVGYLVSSRSLLDQRVRLRYAPPIGLLIGILALALITVPTSVWPSHSIGYIIDAFGKNVLFVYLVLQAVRTDRDARIIAATLVAGCSLLALAVVVHLGPVVTYGNEPGRVAVGGSYDPNDMALLLVIAIPFAFFMIDSCRLLSKILLVAAIALMLVGLAFTESRGGFLGLCAIGVLMFLIGSRQARRLTLLVAGGSVLMFTFIAPRSFWNRISTIYNYEGDYNLREEGGRVAVWKTGLQMIAANPVTGVGIACFPVEHGALSGSRLQIAAHNSLIQIAAELGVVGLILFVTIILLSIRRARLIRLQARRGEAERSLLWFASAVEVAFLGFAVSGFFLSHAYSPIFCFLTGLAGALVARHRLTRPAVAAVAEELEYV
jgi:O-antigen ligase